MKFNYEMLYGKFICRPNRFIAHVDISGEEIICHVPNTGRLKELLSPGAEVVVSYHPIPHRKTKYELQMVKKNGSWVSIHSQLPNILAVEAITTGTIQELQNYNMINREVTYNDSRFDLQLIGKDICFVEVKGVTLELENRSYFPDAPTQRGRKHIDGLIQAVKDGHRAVLLFVVQIDYAEGFSPNVHMDPAFAQKVQEACNVGVEVLAYKCLTTPYEIKITRKIPILL